MSVENGSAHVVNLGALQSCLVEGDPEQHLRERRLRGRALFVSLGVQTAIVVALLLIPLFGKPERIALADRIMIENNVSRRSNSHQRASSEPVRPAIHRSLCVTCFSNRPSVHVSNVENTSNEQNTLEQELPGNGAAQECVGCTELDRQAGPGIPGTTDTGTEKSRTVHVTHLDPAMLIHRIDPIYPTLARQIGRTGRVELRAMIATDGSIQSLQVVAGDPLFYQSALDAVRQWRYSPTVLNGQTVQVDTYITVIYNMQH